MTKASAKFFSAKGAAASAIAVSALAFPFSVQAASDSSLNLPSSDVERAAARGMI
ncbi:hypothetical protein [Saccharibacillus qingshengii]|uniref:hypothetical protein n=1 Tax=Saccharibacillus qingshengii TaxID=1763540 RepID=UPI001553D7DA|nr:hypothetical protein [Saccharibacillus qingshengii]